MFTGIITHLGEVAAIAPSSASDLYQGTNYTITVPFDAALMLHGASIALNGACMTVIATTPTSFTITASAESLQKTTMLQWQVGTAINIERPLCMGDELGGHIVTGHVDTTAQVVSIAKDGDCWRFVFAAPIDIAPFIAPKGSICINGVSLTVNEVNDKTADNTCHFGIMIIPHTFNHTTFGKLVVGDAVNLEIDTLARYALRWLQHQNIKNAPYPQTKSA